MNLNRDAYQSISEELKEKNISLVAVSKTKPVSDILDLYNLGLRDFGENYVQEMMEKQSGLPTDIRWHYIGHLQSNKVKYIIPFIHLIHSVDSLKLLKEINKQSAKNSRVTDVLLQIHIAREETKFGFDRNELEIIFKTNSTEIDELKNINIAGLMGMASFTTDMEKVRAEFRFLKSTFDQYKKVYQSFKILSMGMSSDYKIAIEEGSNMVRIGSLLFGERK